MARTRKAPQRRSRVSDTIPLSADERRDQQMKVAVFPSEKTAFTHMIASVYGMTVSDWLRGCLLDAHERAVRAGKI